MLAAPSVSLIMNLVIAAGLLVAFLAVYWLDRSQKGLLWSAIAILCGLCGAAVELLIPHLANARPLLLISYGCYLSMVAAVSIAVAHGRDVRPPYALMAGLAAGFLVLRWVAFSLPYDSLLRLGLQQGGYAVLQGFAVYFIVKRPLRGWAEWNFLAAAVASTLQYPLRPALAAAAGFGDRPQVYLTTDYATMINIIFAAVSVWIAIAALILNLRTVVGTLSHAAGVDPLTGLGNRRDLERHVRRHEQAFSKRLDQHAVILLDIDHFKAINDSCGHVAGDAVLRALGDIIRGVLGPSHTAARLGGEEFVLIIRHCELGTARLCAEGLRMAIEMVSLPELGGEKVTASFGISAWRRGQSFSEALTLADDALYRAKSEGRNRVAMSEAASPAEVRPSRRRRRQAG